jgi:hypothetical protein
VTDPQRPFEYDTSTDSWAERTIKVAKPGYDPVERKISWDNGQSDYVIDLLPKTKAVRIVTDPPGGDISIDGVPAKSTPEGLAASLVFKPVDEAGKLPTYTVRATKKTADAEWYPAEAKLAWDNGQSAYMIKLREVLSQNVPADGVAAEARQERVDARGRAADDARDEVRHRAGRGGHAAAAADREAAAGADDRVAVGVAGRAVSSSTASPTPPRRTRSARCTARGPRAAARRR